MGIFTEMSIVFVVTVGGMMLPIYHNALIHRKEAQELERQYEEVCGQQPVRPYERKDAGRFSEFLYNWPLKVCDGEALICIYKDELRRAIREAAQH